MPAFLIVNKKKIARSKFERAILYKEINSNYLTS